MFGQWLPYRACRRLLVDPRHLREMPLTFLVDYEGRIAISCPGVVDSLVFEDLHQRAARRIVVRSAYFAHK